MPEAKIEESQEVTKPEKVVTPILKGRMSNKKIILIVLGALLLLCCGCCAIFAIIPTPKTSNTDNTIKTEATKTVTATTQSVTATPTNTPTPTATPTPFPSELKQSYKDNLNRYKIYLDNGTKNNASFTNSNESVYTQFARAKDLQQVYLSCAVRKVEFDKSKYPDNLQKGLDNLNSIMSEYCLQQYSVMKQIQTLLDAENNDDIYNASDNLQYFLGLSNEQRDLGYVKITELTNLVDSLK